MALNKTKANELDAVRQEIAQLSEKMRAQQIEHEKLMAQLTENLDRLKELMGRRQQALRNRMEKVQRLGVTFGDPLDDSLEK